MEVKLRFVSSSNVLHRVYMGNERRMEIRIPYVYISAYVEKERTENRREVSLDTL